MFQHLICMRRFGLAPLDIPCLTKKRVDLVTDPVNQGIRFRFADARFSNEKVHPKFTLCAITI
ncbi:hypothetical protein CK220_23970 [Mesorhizobium sp. WSM3860]|nr:hypothetical protein CK220_23970 [Mesorhizobium sp. WSM3860]